jgi:hypothetical protein
MDAGYIQQTSPEITARFLFSLLGAIGGMLADTDDADKPRVRAECGVLVRRLLSGLRVPSLIEKSATAETHGSEHDIE